uniref:Uncharacterized protein n=1 Tax=Caenorhabditis japonica TaxID=281687 RepID=A0A8R1HLA2_CAEJA
MRKCLLTAMHFQSTSKEGLEKSKTLVRKNGDLCEISSRAAAFAAASALKLKKWKDVDEMLHLTSNAPPVISSSIRICALSEQAKLNEALTELEKLLCLEETLYLTENYCVSDEALDSLCEAIKAQPDSTEKMKRFRNLQRSVTKYGRRTEKSIEELLFTPIRFENSTFPATISDTNESFAKSDKFDTFVRQIPYLKDEKK